MNDDAPSDTVFNLFIDLVCAGLAIGFLLFVWRFSA